jgi:hypothetical protein
MLRNQIPCQIGGPLAGNNPFLKSAKRIPARAHGGVMNHPSSGKVRIDTVQHQAHALLLALNLLFPESPRPTKTPLPPSPPPPQ